MKAATSSAPVTGFGLDGRGERQKRMPLTTWGVLLGLVLIEWTARLVFVDHEPFYPDSCTYLSLSRAISQGDLFTRFQSGATMFFPPLYSILTAFVSIVTRDMESAAALVSSAAGAALLIPNYFFARMLYGERAAWLAVAFVGINPLLFGWSIHMLTEPLFTLIFITVAAVGLRALATHGFRWWVFAGMLCGLAYLTRVIGIAGLGILLGWIAVEKLRGHLAPRPAFAAAAAFVIGLLIVVSPYWLSQAVETGRWTLAGSYGSIARVAMTAGSQTVAGWEDGVVLSISTLPRKLAANAVVYAKATLVSLPVVAVLAITWPLIRRWRLAPGIGRGAGYLLSWLLVYTAVLLILPASPFDEEHQRYLLPILPFWLILAAGVVARLTQRRLGMAKALSVIVVLAVGASSAYQIREISNLRPTPLWVPTPPSRVKELGRLIKEHDALSPTIMARKPFVAYHAGGIWFLTPTSLDGVRRLAEAQRVKYLIVDRDFDSYTRPQLTFLLDPQSAPPWLQLVAAYQMDSGTIYTVAYRIKTDESD